MKTPTLLVALFVLAGCRIGFARDTCFECHLVMEGMSTTYTNDIHHSKDISCADCHGGDANETNQNISMNASRGFKVRVQRPGVPEYCGRCHSDAAYMARQDATLRVDQLARYTNSIHGQQLAAGRRRSAECVDCHSVHNIRPASDPRSTASPQNISQTCAKCHASSLAAYAGTRHAQRFTTARQPGCTVCHSAHDTAPATSALLSGPGSVCNRCHRPGSRQARVGADLAQYLSSLEAAGPASKDALARARIAVHTMNLAAVKRAAETPPPPPDSDAK